MTALAVTALDALPRWVAWRNEDRNGKPTKIPYDPGTGERAKSDDPATWASKGHAQSCARRIVNGAGGGIGIMLGDLGNGCALGGIDLDTCREPDGTFLPWALEVMQRFASYCEISPSKTGAKIFFIYELSLLPALRSKMKTDWGKVWKMPVAGAHPPGIELHLGNRYFTMTWDRLDVGAAELTLANPRTLLWLLSEAGPALTGTKAAKPQSKAPEPVTAPPALRERIEAAAAQHANLGKRWRGDWSGLQDASQSGKAMALGTAMARAGFNLADVGAALALHADTAEWAATKGAASGGRELRRIFEKANPPPPDKWGTPDMSVTGTNRRAPPLLPLESFGTGWADWITVAAEAASCPPDYVAIPLLTAASALIGNARWAEATPGWREPPHLWAGVVGDSGASKSPGADCILGDVLPELERRMQGDFPDRMRDWKAASEAAKAATEQWEKDVRDARKGGNPAPLPPPDQLAPQPQSPRLRQNDVTIEKVASLLAGPAPKGLLIVRDELAGWLLGMTTYNDAGRQFWIEAYGGRAYRVERQKNPDPIDVPRLAVAVTGGTQPDKLAELFRDPDDGLLARILWAWPDALPFRLGRVNPSAEAAIDALDRLRLLDLAPGAGEGEAARPIMVPLAAPACHMLETFGQDMQARQKQAGGLMQSAYGKARGVALRLSLVLSYLRWCMTPGWAPPPAEIGEEALAAACDLVADYFMPMAERVYGDAATPPAERNAATLARWILRTRAQEVYVRELQRVHRLPGLNDAGKIRAACDLLIEADWLREPPSGAQGQRAKVAYPVNPALWADRDE